jgi:hypothetical protein
MKKLKLPLFLSVLLWICPLLSVGQNVSQLPVITTPDLTLTDKLYLTDVEAVGAAKDKSVLLSQLITLFGPTITPSLSNVTGLQAALDGKLNNAAAAAFMPVDNDLIAIAALPTTSFGRSVLTAANDAGLRSLAGLGTLATQNGTFSGTSSGTNTGDQNLSGYLLSATAATTYAPLNHTQAISSVTGLQAALDAKEPSQSAASQPEMVAGTEPSIRSVSPLRIKQAIDARLTVNGAGFARIVAADGSVHHVAVTAGEPPLLTVLTGQTANLATAISAARRTVPNYTGSLIRVHNVTTSVQTDIPQTSTGLLNESALLAARTTGQKLVIHTFYDQDGTGDNLVTGDVTKALRIVDASGNIERLGRMPVGKAEADSVGMYRTGTLTAYTGTTLSGYFVGMFARSPGIFGSYGYGVTNGTGALWASDAAAILISFPMWCRGFALSGKMSALYRLLDSTERTPFRTRDSRKALQLQRQLSILIG